MTYDEASDLAGIYNSRHNRTQALIHPAEPSAETHSIHIMRYPYSKHPLPHHIVKAFRTYQGAHAFIISKPGKRR